MLGEATFHYAHARFKELKVFTLLIFVVYLNHSLNIVTVAVLTFQIHEEIEGENTDCFVCGALVVLRVAN